MKRPSIRRRLLIAGTATIGAALVLAGIGLSVLFDRHVERVAVDNLDDRAMALLTLVEPDGGGGGRLRGISLDPLYEQPFSGNYWQIWIGSDLHRSRSLWDATLALDDTPPETGQRRVMTLPGPAGEQLLVIDRTLSLGSNARALPLRIAVAEDRSQLVTAGREFMRDLIPYLSLLGLFLLVASAVQVMVGLQPLALIGTRLAALASGTRPRIGQDLPVEVIPLVTEIDALLDSRDQELERARHRAADLAHGFKTPLQALLGDAETLRDKGEDEIADNIETVVVAMRRLVDRELARARIQSDRTRASSDPALVLQKLVGVLRRTPQGAELDWQFDTVPGRMARIDPDDLTEALGALLENAVRHAETRIVAGIGSVGDRVVITIRDDGPGVPEAQLAHMIRRGVRLDQSGDGHGIGLAIVSEIIAAAGGDLDFGDAAPGLLVRITLNAVPAA